VRTKPSLVHGAIALVAVVLGLLVARSLGASRSPRRQLNGHGAIVGSLDTWPPVPENPARRAR
jgi:hypothetical protein